MSSELTTMASVGWGTLAPVVAPAVAILLVLLLDAIAPARTGVWARLLDAVAVAGLLGAGGAVAWLSRTSGPRMTVCVPRFVEVNCSFTASQLTLTLQAVVVIGALGCLLLGMHGTAATDRTPHHVLLLTATAGALALAGARDLATLVVALETASLPAVGLVAIRRDARGAQAGLTLLLTAVSSLGLLLLGVALIYLSTGSLYLSRIALVLTPEHLTNGGVQALAGLGAVLAVAGVAFKLSAVPFHLWTPDTYAGAPLPVAAFLAVVSKTAGLAAMVVLLGVGLPGLAKVWAPVVGVAAAVTVTVGNLVALRQTRAVRLLAWSTVAQAGWVLLPFAAASSGTASDVRAASAGAVGYLIAYATASLAAFAVVVLVARSAPGGESHDLEAYRGLARRKPLAAAALGFALACLAGLPPGVMGLVAKIAALRPLVSAGVWPLAVVAAVNVALGLAYYLRWGALLVSGPAEGREPLTWRTRPAEGLVVALAGLGCVAFSVLPQGVAGVLPGVLH